MRQKPIIQRSLGVLMLVLFTISVIPKSFFHDAIATHKDAVACEFDGKSAACIHQQGFHCSFNDLVVSSPYISFNTAFSLDDVAVVSVYSNNFYSSHLAEAVLAKESRGPPFVS